MTIKPTQKQLLIYNALKELIDEGIPTTYINLSSKTGFCLSYLYETMLSLERKGMVERTPGAPASLRIPDD